MRREKRLKISEKNYEKHKLKMKLYFRDYRIEQKEKTNKISRESRNRIRLQALICYTPDLRCSWCQDCDINTLCIDHINNDGYLHRSENRYEHSGQRLYNWLKKNNYPPGFQVLCMNCNIAKQNNGGILPNARRNKCINIVYSGGK